MHALSIEPWADALRPNGNTAASLSAATFEATLHANIYRAVRTNALDL